MHAESVQESEVDFAIRSPTRRLSRRSSCRTGSAYGSVIGSHLTGLSEEIEQLPPILGTASGEREESRAEFKARWLSLIIVLVVQFLLMLQNSIFWNSLWPFLSTIDPTADETFLGFVLMSFSLAGALSSPFFGWWTNRIQETKRPIIAGIFVSIAGNVLVAFVESFPYNRKWILLAARFITGLGCGNYGSLYAYVVMASKISERSRAISIRASLNSVALLLGPALQTAFVPIGFPGFVSGWFHLDLYTATAWANALAGVIQVIIMSTVFHEYWISVDESELKKDVSPVDGETVEVKKLKPFCKWAALACIWIRFAFQFSLTFDGTISSPFTMLMFGWTASEAVLYNGIIQIFTSAIDLTGNLVMGNIVLKYIEERKTIVVGLTLASLFFVINFSWPGLPPLMDPDVTAAAMEVMANQSTLASSSVSTVTQSGLVSVTQAASTARNMSQMSAVGSLCAYSWCHYTTRVYFWQYMVAKVCFVLSVSIGYTPNATIFSKILGPRKQGTLQGAFAGIGQFAMTISPLLSGAIWQASGPRMTYGIGFGIIVSAMVMLFVFYSKLVPWKDYGEDDIVQKPSGKTDELKPLLGADE